MKRLLFFTGLLFLHVAAMAQADSFYVSNKWCARKDTLLLFTGSNNIIQVYNKGMKPAEYKVKSLDKNLRIGNTEVKDDTLCIMAMPYQGKDKKMRLAILNKKTSKTIKTISFVCDSVPKPIAQLGTINTNEAPQKTILEQITFRVVFPNSLYNYPYRIKSYIFKVQSAKGSATIPATGPFIAPGIVKEIAEAPIGTTIEFTNIQVTCPECVTKTIDDVKIRIK